MNEEKRKPAEKAARKARRSQEFFGHSYQEQAYVDLKRTLSNVLTSVRKEKQLTQAALAQLINSSQSRVAKMEAGDPSVSIDLIIKGLLALDVNRQTLADSIGESRTKG